MATQLPVRVCLIYNTSRTYCGRVWTESERDEKHEGAGATVRTVRKRVRGFIEAPPANCPACLAARSEEVK